MSIPIAHIPSTVGDKTLALVRNAASRYRYGTLGECPLNDYAARIRIAWACDTSRAFPSPEALAEALTDEQEAGLFSALDQLLPAPSDEKKST